MDREEAVKIVRENMHLSYDEGNIFEALKTLVPELQESEDERIRKALIEGVSQIRCKGEITREQMIAYLEKQKEQKPDDQYVHGYYEGFSDSAKAYRPAEWSEDEKHRKWILEYLHDGLRKADDQFKDNFKAAIAWLEKQKEQKPAEWSEEDKEMLQNVCESLYSYQCYIRGGEMDKNSGDLLDDVEREKDWLKTLPERFNLQPKQEWSEEDKKMVETICKEGDLKPSEKRWFKSLPERFNLQPKQEWSEEDEKMVQFWNIYYEHKVDDWPNKDVVEHLERFKEWLNNRFKSLRPKLQWRPSIAQLNAVKKAYKGEIFAKEVLFNLYNDLLVIFCDGDRRAEEHWKPSEEQMDALKYALGDGGKFDKAALASLYEQLKKL